MLALSVFKTHPHSHVSHRYDVLANPVRTVLSAMNFSRQSGSLESCSTLVCPELSYTMSALTRSLCFLSLNTHGSKVRVRWWIHSAPQACPPAGDWGVPRTIVGLCFSPVDQILFSQPDLMSVSQACFSLWKVCGSQLLTIPTYCSPAHFKTVLGGLDFNHF